MKLRAEILSIYGDGERIIMKMQATNPALASWRPYLSLEIQVHDTDQARRFFKFGRLIAIEFKP